MAEFYEFAELIDTISFKHRTASSVTRSVSGERQSFGYGGGYWALQCTFRNMNHLRGRRVAAFFSSLEGRSETFTIRLPWHLSKSSPYDGNVIIDGAGQFGKQLNVKGMEVNQKTLYKGDFIKFPNTKKIYQLAKDLESDNLGKGVLYLHMPIVGDLPNDNDSILHNPLLVEWTVALEQEEFIWDLDVFSRSAFELELGEVWN